MDAPKGPRRAAWAAYAGLLGAGIGLSLSALNDTWIRLASEAYTRATLFHALGLVALALVAFWASAAVRTWAMRPPPGRRVSGEVVIPAAATVR